MRTFLAAAILLATSIYSPASGQEVGKCAPDEIVAKDLRDNKQYLVTVGFINGQTLFGLYANKGGDNWTAVAIRSDQISCVIAKGVELQRVIIEPRGEKV